LSALSSIYIPASPNIVLAPLVPFPQMPSIFAIQLLPSLSHILVVSVVSVCLPCLYLILRAICYLLFSPLSKIPGPWYAAVSDFWLTTHVLRLEKCKTIQKLFEVYGPVVRVGPNKVVFCDFSAMHTVYSVLKFDKSPYYKSLLTYALSTVVLFYLNDQLNLD
jgi:hypothetical protein